MGFPQPKVIVPEAIAAECLTSAQELLVHMRAWLKTNMTELL